MNHGTRGCYLTYKCRCDSCVLAAKIYRNEQRLRTGKVLKSRPRLNGTTIVCKFCKNEFAYTRSRNKHCPDCIKNHKVRRKTWDDDVSTNIVAKKLLIEEFGHKCFSCGLSEWMSKPVTLELEHSDGDSGNYFKDNLKLLCPNCHSLTPTYKGKNRGKGRFKRKQRYQAGLSY